MTAHSMRRSGIARAAAAPAPRYRCGLYVWRDGVLRGFAVDLDAPERVLTIAVESRGRRIGEFPTGEPRPDLAAAAPGNVAGFGCDFAALPEAELAALEAALAAAAAESPLDAETLSLRVGADGPRLNPGGGGLTCGEALAQCRAARARNAPTPPRAVSPQQVRFIAGVDGVKGASLKGWAIDLADPRASVRLALEAKGRWVADIETHEHRADIGDVLAGNVAGFSCDLAALPQEAGAALAAALADANPAAPVPPGLVALRLLADDSPIELGGFGVTAGVLLDAIAGKPAPEAPARGAPRPRAAPPPSPESRALNWLLRHIGAGAADDPRPARRFTARLIDEIERDPAVSDAVKRHAREISPLFDPFHYLDRLGAADEAVANPLLHYALTGWRDGASPHPLFSPAHYKSRRGAFAGDPLVDFLREGARRDIDPHPLFDIAFYRAHGIGRDVNPLQHYLDEGGARRLDPSPLFDSGAFLDRYGLGPETDVPLAAYLVTPTYWDFDLSPAFDAALYRHQVEIERGEKLAEPPYLHYLAQGYRDETLLPNLLFDPAFYRERNKLDFAGPALGHYLSEGEAAGLACHPHFSPLVYNAERGIEGGAGALTHALAHPGRHRSDKRMAGPIDPRLFALVRDLVAERGVPSFRASLYREANPDLDALSESELETHYRDRGAAESRLASLTQLMQLGDIRVREIPLGFVLDDYVAIYPDLGHFKDRLISALFHYARFGRAEKRLVGKWLFHIDGFALDKPTADAPLRVAPRGERVDVCILIHAFYADLLPELVGFAQNFRGVSFDIFINVVDLAWTPAVQQELRAICPGAFVMLSNDLGRDIGGFTRLLSHVDIARYESFAFLHSKKSPHVAPEKGEYWRRTLLMPIAGAPETARKCVTLFKQDPHIGMIGAKEWRSDDMGKNVEQYERLLDLLGVGGRNRELDYLSGFMFLIRSDVVARLYQTLRTLDFEYGGDKDLEFHRDGQLAHGVERAVPALVRQMGYEIHYR